MAKKIAQKTNAARLLDKAGIKYDMIVYEVDPDNLDARHVADSLGEDIEKVFKTLVLSSERGHFVCVIPGNREVDLKKAAKAINAKKAEMLPMKELLATTGYIRGGCSPIGMKKQFPTFIHESAQDFDRIFISAGTRGLQLSISPEELKTFVSASFCDIIKDDVIL